MFRRIRALKERLKISRGIRLSDITHALSQEWRIGMPHSPYCTVPSPGLGRGAPMMCGYLEK